MEHPAPIQPRVISIQNVMGFYEIKFAVHDLGVTMGSTFLPWADIFLGEYFLLQRKSFTWQSSRKATGKVQVAIYSSFRSPKSRMFLTKSVALYEPELFELAKKSRELLRLRREDGNT